MMIDTHDVDFAENHAATLAASRDRRFWWLEALAYEEPAEEPLCCDVCQQVVPVVCWGCEEGPCCCTCDDDWSFYIQPNEAAVCGA